MYIYMYMYIQYMYGEIWNQLYIRIIIICGSVLHVRTYMYMYIEYMERFGATICACIIVCTCI